MSSIECIQVHCALDVISYLAVLKNEYGAQPHPSEPDSYLIDNPSLPFRRPRQLEQYMSILGFNYVPLSSLLILALINHPELAPVETIVIWSSEQDILVESQLADLGTRFTNYTK